MTNKKLAIGIGIIILFFGTSFLFFGTSFLSLLNNREAIEETYDENNNSSSNAEDPVNEDYKENENLSLLTLNINNKKVLGLFDLSDQELNLISIDESIVNSAFNNKEYILIETELSSWKSKLWLYHIKTKDMRYITDITSRSNTFWLDDKTFVYKNKDDASDNDGYFLHNLEDDKKKILSTEGIQNLFKLSDKKIAFILEKEKENHFNKKTKISSGLNIINLHDETVKNYKEDISCYTEIIPVNENLLSYIIQNKEEIVLLDLVDGKKEEIQVNKSGLMHLKVFPNENKAIFVASSVRSRSANSWWYELYILDLNDFKISPLFAEDQYLDSFPEFVSKDKIIFQRKDPFSGFELYFLYSLNEEKLIDFQNLHHNDFKTYYSCEYNCCGSFLCNDNNEKTADFYMYPNSDRSECINYIPYDCTDDATIVCDDGDAKTEDKLSGTFFKCKCINK